MTISLTAPALCPPSSGMKTKGLKVTGLTKAGGLLVVTGAGLGVLNTNTGDPVLETTPAGEGSLLVVLSGCRAGLPTLGGGLFGLGGLAPLTILKGLSLKLLLLLTVERRLGGPLWLVLGFSCGLETETTGLLVKTTGSCLSGLRTVLTGS